ncbi:zf-DHHC-domain-containing protein, partial [Aureobasidium melanogenum]
LNHPATPVASGHKSSSGRNYQYFNGNAVFFLHGRLINARQRPLNVFTALLAVIPAALFFGFSAPWLWHHVSPAIPILFAYVFFICISSYLHASFSEPGIIPRNLHPQPPTPADEDPLAIGPSTTEWVTVRSFGPNASGNGTTAMEVPIKFCKS